jgi:hypothetical protein
MIADDFGSGGGENRAVLPFDNDRGIFINNSKY